MRLYGRYTILMALTASAVALRAHAEGSQYYPEAALNSAYSAEQLQEKRTMELERENVEKRDRYERMKRETERQIQAHRFEIENLKVREEKAQQEIDQVNTNLAHVKDEIASYEDEHKKFDDATRATMEFLSKNRNELQKKQQDLDQQIASLADAKKKAEKYIYDASLEVARMKAEVTKADTKLAEAEANRAVYEADEMKVRTDWMRVKMETAEHLKQRDDAVAEMNEAKKRADAAAKELAAARGELARAEKEHAVVAGRVKGDVAKWERDVQTANHNRLMAEAEKIRLESETAKVQDYAARIKDNRDEALTKAEEAQGLVLKSTVALTSARTELGESIAQSDRKMYRRQKEEAQSRGLASAAEAHQIMEDGVRSWTSNKDCKVYSSTFPVSDDEKKHTEKERGRFPASTTVMGKKSGLNWLEVRNSSGDSVFIQRRCGHFDKKAE